MMISKKIKKANEEFNIFAKKVDNKRNIMLQHRKKIMSRNRKIENSVEEKFKITQNR